MLSFEQEIPDLDTNKKFQTQENKCQSHEKESQRQPTRVRTSRMTVTRALMSITQKPMHHYRTYHHCRRWFHSSQEPITWQTDIQISHPTFVSSSIEREATSRPHLQQSSHLTCSQRGQVTMATCTPSQSELVAVCPVDGCLSLWHHLTNYVTTHPHSSWARSHDWQ